LPFNEYRDPDQLRAVEAIEPTIAVLAGPGSGKTRTLANRAHFLLTKHSNDSVRLLTFTNKAAAEMKERALRVPGQPSKRLTAGTFHTFGLEVLRNHGSQIGVGHEFEIIDDDEQKSLCQETGLDEHDLFSWRFVRLRGLKPTPGLLSFGRAYQAAKLKRNVVDFDDLIVYTAELLEQNAPLAKAYVLKHPHLLVDEFQDTSPAQFRIVTALVPHIKTIGVFADDDQAIFEFAGAEARNVKRFIQQLAAKELPIYTNYRCAEKVVTLANKLISSNPQSSGRLMKPYRKGGRVQYRHFDTPQEEAEWVSDEIEQAIRNGAAAKDFAVLVRGAFRAAFIVKELEHAGLPVGRWFGPRYASSPRKAIQICLSVARGKLTDRQAARLRDFLQIPDSGELVTARLLPSISHPGIGPLRKINEIVWKGARPTELLAEARACIECVDASLVPGLDQIAASVQGIQARDPDFNLDNLLAELALGGVAGSPTDEDSIKISTIHRAKGLQWPSVYLVGLEEGVLPDFRAENDDEKQQEEIRACFVGICRAEDDLRVTSVAHWGTWSRQPSRFLSELGLIE
jgi:DNA helicase II / ATP-dependent DNA helicase PcrA